MVWSKEIPLTKLIVWKPAVGDLVNRYQNLGRFVGLKTLDIALPPGATSNPPEAKDAPLWGYLFRDPEYPQVYLKFFFATGSTYKARRGYVPVYGDPEAIAAKINMTPDNAQAPVRQSTNPQVPENPEAKPGLTIGEQVALAARQREGEFQVGLSSNGEMFFNYPEPKKAISPFYLAGGAVLIGGLMLAFATKRG